MARLDLTVNTTTGAGKPREAKQYAKRAWELFRRLYGDADERTVHTLEALLFLSRHTLESAAAAATGPAAS